MIKKDQGESARVKIVAICALAMVDEATSWQ